MTLDDWVSVTLPDFIFVGIADRAAFDKIALPVTDGAERDRAVLTKSMTGNGVTVVFQHWYGPTEAERRAQEAVARIRQGSVADAHARVAALLAGRAAA